MSSTQRLLIFDNSCWARLLEPEVVRTVQAQLRVSGFRAMLTDVNLKEAAKTESQDTRDRLCATMASVCELQSLPWPLQILHDAAAAIAGGESPAQVVTEPLAPLSEGAWLVREDVAPHVEFLRTFEQEFQSWLDGQRARFRARIKSLGVRAGDEEAAQFLDAFRGSQPERTLADAMWLSFGLEGQAPLETLRDVRAWRLALECDAMHVFERLYRHPTKARGRKPPPSRADLLKVIYLGLADQAVLVTRDERLAEVGNRVLLGRYGLRQVVLLDEWLAS